MPRAALATFLVLGLSGSLSAQEGAPSSFRWRTDLAAARTQAQAEGRPLLIVFR